MEQFQGSERLILQTIVDSPKDSAGFVEDAQIAKAQDIASGIIQNWLETLEGKGFVERGLGLTRGVQRLCHGQRQAGNQDDRADRKPEAGDGGCGFGCVHPCYSPG